MYILTAQQHRSLDQATISRHGISSEDLMERAATAFTEAFIQSLSGRQPTIIIVAGSGNNGGDGLVAARLLHQRGYTVKIYLAEISAPSQDNLANQEKATRAGLILHPIEENGPLPNFPKDAILVDALFGTGLSRPITGYWAELIHHLNQLPLRRVAIDLPSGLMADGPSQEPIFRAHHTFTLGYPKLCLYAPANTDYLGDWSRVSFQLADDAVPEIVGEANQPTPRQSTAAELAPLLRPRRANDHKGTFGHVLLYAGSFGSMGAAVLTGRAILRTGAGLLTCHVPRSGYEIMQISFPEAMCEVDAHRYHATEVGPLDRYTTLAIGPGLGTEALTEAAFGKLLTRYDRPIVVDADGLNLLARNPSLMEHLPANSILTPHPKEFERLFGQTDDDFARWELQREMARTHQVILLLKTGYTSIALPDGRLYFNPTGNPGMGTAGMGDALTGVLAGLLAQGYSPEQAALLGVYLHGLAGDLAASELGQESLLAEDLINYLGQAFRGLRSADPTTP
ncbi:NAD(P)H-hydrate dehydratase [Lewinella sp. W8]|uniref:NAD(P)H-hydrate dehydratase n=1 Tax=Lewinella sp. W8 TaxID=2528208 RepID=UPI001067544C|nr:NAD(P)H-hydrate dehydratase [Lewinella sp. W8]MTB53090.1 NAD(P)H-hydrate dehydratase [Lewinella sp. W8]